VPNFIAQALAEEPLTVYGDGSQTRSFCYVNDTVEGLMKLLDVDDPNPTNIGNPDERTILELAELIIEKTGSASAIELEPLPTDDPQVRCPDISRAKSLFGWEPVVPLEDGVERTIDWFRTHLSDRAPR
jgi:dTDP-glucose 4,6-dehydratase